MSTKQVWMAALSVLALLLAGCDTLFLYGDDPVVLRQVCKDGTLDCFGTGTGGTGGTTTVTPGCIPSENDSGVADTCGVFVSASLGKDVDEKDRGTKGKPWATIAAALGAATGKPVYVCGETFTEAVEITAGARVYGALDCTKADWPYAAEKRTVIAPTAEGVALRVTSKAKLELYDVNITSVDATTAGGSSIAMLAEADTDVMLKRCDVEAGAGKDGAAGEPFASDATEGLQGSNGGVACSGGSVDGGMGPLSECGDLDSIGGKGGDGDLFAGGDGSKGLPAANSNAGTGQPDDAGMCTAGTVGDDGAAGTSGAGAKTLGTLDAQGFAGAPGDAGMKGQPAQGGGGGGGAKGGDGSGPKMNQCNKVMGAAYGGASGGSGGSGGCGGEGGKGGQAGGASIGVVSLGATLTFTDVKITAKNGGTGGAGGLGQNGGAGGPGGAGGTVPPAASDLKPGCGGGAGGTGGPGGRGGGGRGGLSIGIAHTGAAPSLEGATITPGKAGEGGEGDGAAGHGEPGVSKPVQVF